MLNLVGIKKSFNDRPILRDISFTVKKGQLALLKGQNGAGKSTLFDIIVGLCQADEGQVSINDVVLNPYGARQRSQFIGVLRQDPKTSSVSSLSILENCALALQKSRRVNLAPALSPEVKTKIVAHLKELNLTFLHDLERPMASFSGGQRQMLAFAMATINRPHLLLLDEPTAALDEHASEQLMDLVKRLICAWQIPAVMICHDPELSLRHADAVFELKDGMIR